MALGKYDAFIERGGITLVEGWARDGLTEEQIAHNIGIARKTLVEWKKQHSELCNALKRGKEVVDYEVENALYKRAKAGDVTACIFWLKNRRPDKWRDKPVALDEVGQEKLNEMVRIVKSLQEKPDAQ